MLVVERRRWSESHYWLACCSPTCILHHQTVTIDKRLWSLGNTHCDYTLYVWFDCNFQAKFAIYFSVLYKTIYCQMMWWLVKD